MLKNLKRVHILACGGIGMSAIALLMLESGIKVSGSDSKKSQLVLDLIAKGLMFYKEDEDFGECDLIVFSSAIKQDHPSWILGHQRNITFMHRAEALNWLMKGKKALLVAGTHGKTTTSSLLVHALKHLGEDISYAVGGTFSHRMKHAHLSSGCYFVIEADESDGSFLKFDPYACIVTNIDDDHLDHWQSLDCLEEGFRQFLQKVHDKSLRVFCGDDPRLSSLGVLGTSYGSSARCDFKLYYDEPQEHGRSYIFLDHHGAILRGQLQLTGHHNALNALSVFALLCRLGFNPNDIIQAMATFGGVDRRCQIKGRLGNSLWIDDYGHHPSEIKATLQGLRERFKDKSMTVVFQPHRYSRTHQLWQDFLNIFTCQDRLIVTDIYGFNEDNPHQIHAKDLASDIQKYAASPVEYLSRDQLKNYMYVDDVIITFGAGDVSSLYHEVINL